jgi:hypothetical protein
MKSPKDLLLILGSICFIIVLGAAVYEHIVLIPKWSAAPPASLTMYQGTYGLHPENFWIPIHPITLALLVAALITNWNNTRRKDLLTVMVGYVLILLVTFTYFVPTLIRITSTPFQDTADQTLVDQSSMWETLSLIRLGLIVILSIILLSALTKPNKIIVVHEVAAVPLNYENDSKGG